MGQGRLELPTSRLSGVRSNQLSYWPSVRAARKRDGSAVVGGRCDDESDLPIAAPIATNSYKEPVLAHVRTERRPRRQANTPVRGLAQHDGRAPLGRSVPQNRILFTVAEQLGSEPQRS